MSIAVIKDAELDYKPLSLCRTLVLIKACVNFQIVNDGCSCADALADSANCDSSSEILPSES